MTKFPAQRLGMAALGLVLLSGTATYAQADIANSTITFLYPL
jgi:hypothetical protein